MHEIWNLSNFLLIHPSDADLSSNYTRCSRHLSTALISWLTIVILGIRSLQICTKKAINMRAGIFQTMWSWYPSWAKNLWIPARMQHLSAAIPGEVARESNLSNICMRRCMNLADIIYARLAYTIYSSLSYIIRRPSACGKIKQYRIVYI